ncbi:MAG: hypothetical protein ABEK01_02225 [Candidatus Nanohaloarchaea archaeon]
MKKGQSAIEYLMSYGWMLVVVAVVGAAFFAFSQGQCQKSSMGFGGEAVQIAQFGVNTDGHLQFILRNGAGEPVNVTRIEVLNGNGRNASSWEGKMIPVADSEEFTVENVQFRQAGMFGCNSFSINIEYDQIGGLSNQEVSGSVTSSIDMGATSPPSAPSGLSITTN